MKVQDIDGFLAEKSSGFLQLGGARMALLDIESGFWGIRRQMEALIGNKLTNAVLQQAGANGGASFAKSFTSTLDQTGADIFSACLQVYQSAGFGSFEITMLDWPIGQVSIRADQTFEAWMISQNDQSRSAPCCAYTAGVLVGFVNVIGERKDIVCIERFCQGKGDEFCQFDLIPAVEAKDQSVVSFSPDPGLGRQINLLEMLFERMPMGIAVLDREYRLQRYNPTWEDFAERYAPTSAAPLVPGVCYFDHIPGSEATVLPLFERASAGETIRQNAVRLESKGIVSYWDVVLAPLIENAEIVGILNVAVDATEREAIQQNLEQRVEERTREIQRRQQVSESLRDLMVALNSERSSQEVFDYIAAQSAMLLRADACMIYSVQNGVLTKESAYNLPETFLKINTGKLYLGDANKSLLNGNPVQITDALSYLNDLLEKHEINDFQRRWYTAIRDNYSSYLGIPLVVRNQLFGGLVVYFKSKRRFNNEDIELGLMLGEHAALAIENARLYQAAQNRQSELQTLLDISETANSSLNLDEMLSNTLDLIVSLLNASRAGVLLIEEETENLIPAVLRPERAVVEEDIATFVQACEKVIASGEAQYIEPHNEQGLTEPGALIPLRNRGQILGVLAIIGGKGAEFTEQQMAIFKSIADRVGVAVENTRLFSKAETAAITMERNRLARDLHDAVTQTLFSASLVAEVLPKIWERNPDEGWRRLEEVRQLTRGALSEMRTLLLELRPAALLDTDLDDLIGHLVQAFIARTRMVVEYTKDTNGSPPPAVKEVFYRVAQETFNNISKHAGATKVSVDLTCQSEEAKLIIIDNGIGFNPEKVSADHLGLGIMRERAHGIDAQLTIDSQRDQGTKLQMTWILAEKE